MKGVPTCMVTTESIGGGYPILPPSPYSKAVEILQKTAWFFEDNPLEWNAVFEDHPQKLTMWEGLSVTAGSGRYYMGPPEWSTGERNADLDTALEAVREVTKIKGYTESYKWEEVEGRTVYEVIDLLRITARMLRDGSITVQEGTEGR